MQSMSAYVAQNTGARQPERALRGLRIAIGPSTAFGVVMFYTAFFHGDLLCAIFARDEDVILAGFDYLFTCFLFCFIGFFNGLGRTAFVMAQGIGAAFLIRIPVAYLMSVKTGRLFYIGLSVPCSTIAQITVCFLFLSHVKRHGLMADRTDGVT